MPGRLASPRRRRRLVKLGIALALAATLTGLVIWDPGGVNPPRQEALDRSAPTLPPQPTGDPYPQLPVTPESRR